MTSNDDPMFEVPGSRLREMSDNISHLGKQLDEVYKWLVEELGFPFDMSTREKPPWLDVGKLARFWNEHDNWGITQEDAEAMVWYETGWDHEDLG